MEREIEELRSRTSNSEEYTPKDGDPANHVVKNLKDEIERLQRSRRDINSEVDKIKRDHISEIDELKKLNEDLRFGKKEAEERLSTLEKRYLNLQENKIFKTKIYTYIYIYVYVYVYIYIYCFKMRLLT